jgi:hypothetical protein
MLLVFAPIVGEAEVGEDAAMESKLRNSRMKRVSIYYNTSRWY